MLAISIQQQRVTLEGTWKWWKSEHDREVFLVIQKFHFWNIIFITIVTLSVTICEIDDENEVIFTVSCIVAFDEGNRWGIHREKKILCVIFRRDISIVSRHPRRSSLSFCCRKCILSARREMEKQTPKSINLENSSRRRFQYEIKEREMEKLPFYYLFTFCDIQLALAFMIGHKSNCKTCEATTNFSRKK